MSTALDTMPGPVERSAEPPAVGGEPIPKRRKTRKGTRSCWECKRRKIKCNYTSPEDEICEGCRRRATSCISQEFPEEPTTFNGSSLVVSDRLGKMEALVEQLVKNSLDRRPDKVDKSPVYRSVDTSSAESQDGSQNPEALLPTTKSKAFSSKSRNSPSRRVGVNAREFRSAREQNSLLTSFADDELDEWQELDEPDRYKNLSRRLHAALPTKHDMAIIAGLTNRSWELFHLILRLPYSKVFNGQDQKLEDITKIPPPDSHPVLLALKAMMLAGFLQKLLPQFHPQLNDMEEDPQVVSRRLLYLVETYIINDDDLVGTLEGLQCLVLAAVIQANSGSLRRSWLRFHRALAIGKLMGLHRNRTSSIRRLDPDSRVDPRHLWFRIVYSDRALSLMLGLPLDISDTNVVSDADMQSDTPMGRLERLHTMSTMRILQRNSSHYDDGEEEWKVTQEIDRELQKASAMLPSRWWTVDRLGDSDSQLDLFQDVLRFLNQFYHYNLLIQLHLPFMLRTSPDNRYDYSRMTCVNAARELLTRFTIFRSVNSLATTCRGIDFFSFTASLTLILAHLDAHRHGSGNFLVHQRMSDRGIVERVIQNFEDLHQVKKDIMSSESARLLKRLLLMETEAADGGAYAAGSNRSSSQEFQVEESDDSVHLAIPYFGTMMIAKEGVKKTVPAISTRPFAQEIPEVPILQSGATNGLFSTVATNAGQFDAASSQWQTPQLQSYIQLQPPLEPSAVLNIEGFTDEGVNQEFSFPSLAADGNEWAFQGVDMVFFDTLLRGQISPTLETDGETPQQVPPGWTEPL